MSHRKHNGVLNAEEEVKMEQSNRYEDDDNENGFAGFDNSAIVISSMDIEATLWTSGATSCLISQYKKYHSLVGQTTRLRSLREMFETISLEMHKLGFYFSPQKCENKWRVLERKYKNLVFRERLKKPGRIRHYGHWEHKRALDEIFNERKKHMYLKEGDFPVPSGSLKFVQETARDAESLPRSVQSEESILNSSSVEPRKNRDSLDKVSATIFETLFAEMNKNFALAEKNKERRHKEKMALRQSELEIQRKLLRLKEQKMELRKSQITTASHYLRTLD